MKENNKYSHFPDEVEKYEEPLGVGFYLALILCTLTIIVLLLEASGLTDDVIQYLAYE